MSPPGLRSHDRNNELMSAKIVKVSEVVDCQAIGGFQYFVFLLGAATLFVEGTDMQAIAYVSPTLSKEWGLPRGTLGPVFSAALFGLMIGAFLISPLADRLGRRRIILWSVFLFGALTLLTAMAQSLPSLLVMRFLTGLGLGGAMPNVVALAAEYSPDRKRASIVMFVFTGFPIGAAVGGFIAAKLIPSYGWQSVFIFGGILTLLLWLILILKLPESIHFLALMGGKDKRVPRLISKIDRRIDPTEPVQVVTDEKVVTGITVRHLFQDGRGPVTALLWIVYFMSLLNLYLLASWLPTTINSRGISVEHAVIATSLLHAGGIVGAVVLGLLTARFGTSRVMPASYLLAATCIASITLTGTSVTLTMLAVFCAGFAVIGCQNCNNGFASTLYPTGIRATGVGWANGVGRVGSITGPSIAGVMLSMDVDIASIFITGSAAALCAAGAVAGIAHWRADPVRAGAT